ncbi:DUF7289 family protein [Archaeoglobus sp.]
MKKKVGVSEVVGSLLVFAVIVSTASFLYVMAYPTMKKTQDELNYRNALSNLFEVKEIMKRVKSGNEPMAMKKIPLGGGSISVVKNAVTFQVGSETFTAGDLMIRIAGRELYLEGSGIFERQEGIYSILINMPDIEFIKNGSECDLYLNVYNITGNYSAGGKETTITVSLEGENDYQTATPPLKIYSEFIDEWEKAFNDAAESSGCNPTISKVAGNHVKVEGVRKIMVARYDVGVR